MAARCPQCSTSLTANATVCPTCGFDLTAGQAPAPSQGQTQEIKVTIPPWLTVDWGTPAVGAVLTVLIGVGLQYLVGLLLVIGTVIQSPSEIPFGAIARVPPSVWLGFNLGLRSVTIILTGVLWIRFSVRRAGKLLARDLARADVTADRNKVIQSAAKFAVVYALMELVVAIALRSFTPSLAFDAPAVFPGFGGIADPVGAFFYGLLIGFVAGIFFFTVCAGRPLREVWPVRIDVQIPKVVATVWRGMVTTLKIAIPSMAIFIFLTFILSLVSDGAPPRTVFGVIPTFLAALIFWTGVDTGFLGLLMAMQLFLGSRGAPFVLFGGAGGPGVTHAWVYSGIAIPFIALFIAGMRITRDAQPATPVEAARKGALVGIPLSLVCLLFASLRSSELDGAFIGRAFLVPLLWGGASALGAFFEAGQRAPELPVPEPPV